MDLPPCLIDGEIVAHGKDGNPDFSTLQALLKRGHGSQGKDDALAFHAFDLVELDGEDLTPRTNIERKERLEALLSDAALPIHVADHVIGAGEKLYETMCGAGQEGKAGHEDARDAPLPHPCQVGQRPLVHPRPERVPRRPIEPYYQHLPPLVSQCFSSSRC